jgi:hypothetical protein
VLEQFQKVYTALKLVKDKLGARIGATKAGNTTEPFEVSTPLLLLLPRPPSSLLL